MRSVDELQLAVYIRQKVESVCVNVPQWMNPTVRSFPRSSKDKFYGLKIQT
jgi:hypothetical protein